MLLLHRFQSPAHIFKHSFKSNCVLLTYVMRNVSHQVFLFWHDCTSMVKCVCVCVGGGILESSCASGSQSVSDILGIYIIYTMIQAQIKLFVCPSEPGQRVACPWTGYAFMHYNTWDWGRCTHHWFPPVGNTRHTRQQVRMFSGLI